jgi:DNA replication protein DnaC
MEAVIEQGQPQSSKVSTPLIPKSKSLSLTEAEGERLIRDAADQARRIAASKQPERLIAPQIPLASASSPEAQRATAVEHDQQRSAAIEKRIQAACIPIRYKDATLVNLDGIPKDAEKAYRTTVKAVSRLHDHPGILALLGQRGVGKTWIACGLALDFCRVVRSARYLHVMDYFIGLKETYGEKARKTESGYESDHLRPELLILDEMHERADTAWEDRMLTRLIVKRHELELVTILLSNDTAEQFKSRVGDSVMSRMKDDAGGIVVCEWKSLRGRAS